MKLTALFTAATLVSMVTTVQASTIDGTFDGTIYATNVTSFSAGDPITGSFTFNTDGLTTSSVFNDGFGDIAYTLSGPATFSISVKDGGVTFTASRTINTSVTVSNNDSNENWGGWRVQSGGSSLEVDDLLGNVQYTTNLTDPTTPNFTVTSNAATANYPPFYWAIATAEALDADIDTVQVNIDSLTVSTVPLPASGVLFGSALAGIYGLRRRKNSK